MQSIFTYSDDQVILSKQSETKNQTIITNKCVQICVNILNFNTLCMLFYIFIFLLHVFLPYVFF